MASYAQWHCIGATTVSTYTGRHSRPIATINLSVPSKVAVCDERAVNYLRQVSCWPHGKFKVFMSFWVKSKDISKRVVSTYPPTPFRTPTTEILSITLPVAIRPFPTEFSLQNQKA